MPYLKNLKPLWLPAVVAVFFYLGVKGIGWGLPGKARSDIVLPQELRNAGFYDLMIKKRNEIMLKEIKFACFLFFFINFVQRTAVAF